MNHACWSKQPCAHPKELTRMQGGVVWGGGVKYSPLSDYVMIYFFDFSIY